LEEFWLTFAVIMPLTIVAGGVVVIVMAMYQRTKTLEMQHRERLAMIERGLMPPPDPGAPRNLFAPAPRAAAAAAPPRSRYTTLGVAMVGVGLGLMLLIGVAGGTPDAGIGIGGAVAILGAAFIVNGYLQRSAHVPPAQPPSPPMPAPPSRSFTSTDPPGPIAP
jgi:hypothetical protein